VKAILGLPSGGFALSDVPAPIIGEGELLLEMRACGLCGTDLAKLARPEESAGVRLGHEFAGVVRALGPGVSRYAPGDRLAVAHHVPCGTCWACRHGSESMCPQFKRTNVDPCGFSELIRIPEPHLAQVAFRLPDDLPDEEASFIEPLGCAVRAVERSGVLSGDRIAVVGGGGMGLLIAQTIQARGADAIVLDIAESRLALARELGIRMVLNPGPRGLGGTLADVSGGAGVDGLILTVMTEDLLREAQSAVRSGGRINVFADAGLDHRLRLDFSDLYHRELTVVSTYSSTPASLDEAFTLLAGRRVRVAPLISHRLPLSAFDEGVRLQREGRATKVIFHP
jgi:L-iditol 2-dehydrogenase